MKELIDQRGVEHDFTYNDRRQLELDSVTSLGSSGVVDGAVRSIKRTYDSLGRLVDVESHDTTVAGGTYLNRVRHLYLNEGRLEYVDQYHLAGAPKSVRLRWDAGVDGSGIYTNGLRLYGVRPPSGFQFDFNFGHADPTLHSNTLDDRLGRISGIELDPGTGAYADQVAYKHNGSDRLIEVDYIAPSVRRQMFDAASVNNYFGWDRFGRAIKHQWHDYTSGAAVRDQFEYTYDYVGNRLSRDIPTDPYLANDRDETYTYDGLQRLSQVNAGTFSTGPIADAAAKFRQKWGLDALGNWKDYQQDGKPHGSVLANNNFSDSSDLDQDRFHNNANEIPFNSGNSIMEVSGQTRWPDPAYDSAGNMTTMPIPGVSDASVQFKYDAWNRLVQLPTMVGPMMVCEYDGLHRRIVREVYSSPGTLSHRIHYYYNKNWQVIEERKETGGAEDPHPLNQYVWHPHYVDALAFRRYDPDTNPGTANAEYYYLQDANYNVTAVTDSAGAVVERYAYTPYGQVTVLNGASGADLDGAVTEWSVDASQTASDVGNAYLYTGREYDWETGLQHSRFRYYAPHLGRFLNRDPIGYFGGANLYEYVGGMPTHYVDPLGLYGAATYYHQAMSRMHHGTPLPHERLFQSISDYGPTVVNSGLGIFFEPYDYALTLYEIYKDPSNQWNYAGFLPFLSSGMVKAKKLLDDIPRPSGPSLPDVPPRKPPSGDPPSGGGGKPPGDGKPTGDSCPDPTKPSPLDGPPGFSNPGMGQEVHQRFPQALTEQTGTNVGDWVFRVSPGMHGVDASYRGPAYTYPGFDHAELKPFSVHGFNTFQDQLNRWDLPSGTTQLWFYGPSGVIGTSGLNY